MISNQGKKHLEAILKEVPIAVKQGNDTFSYREQISDTVRLFIVTELEKKGFEVATPYDLRLPSRQIIRVSW